MDYTILLQQMLLIFRFDLFYGKFDSTRVLICPFLLAIHCFCSVICLVLTMHGYTKWLHNYYKPILSARHLERWDMMRSLSNHPQTSSLSVSLKQITPVDGKFCQIL